MTLGPNTILIVAERHPDPDLNTAFLRESRIRLISADRRDEATLALVRDELPDLVIEDLDGGRGVEGSFCARLKADPEMRHTPLILVTEPGRLGEARTTGADALLSKPLVPHAFFDAVRQYVPLPQRRQVRYPINLRFTFEWEGRAIQAFSRDISLTGAFLKTDRPLPEGSHLRLAFVLPGDPTEIRCGGFVRRAQTESAPPTDQGVGVEFEGIHDADLTRLESYVHRRRQRMTWFR